MHINGSLPTQIARAYGVSPKQALAPNKAADQANQPTESIAANTAHKSDSVNGLLAGRVSGPVDFDATTGPAKASSEVLPLYTRAADKVEAAVAVQIGRSLDVKG